MSKFKGESENEYKDESASVSCGCQNHPITAVVDGDWSEIGVT